MIPTFLNKRYQIIKTLGTGGFGETFLAADTHLPSSRRCAIKQLKPLGSQSAISIFCCRCKADYADV